MKDIYYPIKNKSIITEDLITVIDNDYPWMTHLSFYGKLVPYSIIYKDPFFQWLSSHFIFRAAILKLPPNVCYDWHLDDTRGVSINMKLSYDAESLCLFREDSPTILSNIARLDYQPDTYYVFNTQKPHTVLNFDKDRYILSIEFEKEKEELDYKRLKELVIKEWDNNKTQKSDICK